MNITLENIDKVNALVTLKVEESDYQDNVKKELKKISLTANIPGFRKGKVPVAMVTKLYGGEVKAQKINEVVGQQLYTYIRENKINILGEPLPSEKQPEQDIETQKDFEFVFDIALAPEFKVELSDKDKVTFYDIAVDEKVINEQIEEYCRRAGSHKSIDTYEDKAIIRGLLAELDEEGNTKEGGIQIETASIMPTYLKQGQELFNGCKVNDVLTFSPWEVYAGSESEVAALLRIKKEEAQNHKGNFSYQINEISQFVPATVNQELFDKVFGEGNVTSEEDFRKKVEEATAERYGADSDYKFFVDARHYITEKVGKLEYPDATLKRIMQLNNPDKDASYVEEHYEKSLEELTWQLIKNQLVEAYEIKIEDGDMLNMAKEATRFQFAQYGMANLPEELIDQYAGEMLKNKEQAEALVQRVLDTKLIKRLKEVVTLDHKSISLEDFGKMFQ